MSDPLKIEDLMIGVEMGLMTQEQVVSEFRDLVDLDVASAAERYAEFAEKLEQVSSGGNAQIRSMIGGPDSYSRAQLVDIMAGSYATVSNDVKTKIRDEAMRPLFRDNFFYVKMAVARMTNPHLVGDIIRYEPLANPGADYYEEALIKSGDLQDPDLLQFWLGRFGVNFFAASTVALQREHAENVATAINNNEALFRGAAHVVAATHDLRAEIKILKGSTTPKDEITSKYRANFVDGFADMVRQEAEQANWLPIGSMVIQLYSN